MREQFTTKRGGFGSYCKQCKLEYDKQYYAKNDSRQKWQREQNKKVAKRNQDYVWNYLLNHPCVDCGESDPVVLEFDHQKDKISGVGKMSSKQVSISKLQAEIDKCQIRCCNCHRRKTARTLGWHSYSR
jgi:hypothetical protein